MEASALSAPAGLGRGSVTSPWLRLRSDEQLVNLFRSGSEEAFGVIHDRYRPRLHAYARQMLGGGADAEDVMQDVFLRAYRALRVDERPVSLRAWLYRVAHNRCIDGLRRPVPEAAAIYDMARCPSRDTGAEVERRADLRRLIDDVRRLPDQQRSALLMRELDGMSYADLAAALETSVPAVKSLLVRARIGLVEALEARDADCADIRHDLAASYDRGVRASGRARRHLRDCENCATYRTQLRAVRQAFASISPAPAAGLFAKLLGLGGAGSGAAAGGAAAGSGTTAAIGGSAAVAASVTKVAAIVCCAAALTGGAVEVAVPHGPAHAKARHSVAGPGGLAAPAAASPALRMPRPGPVIRGRAAHPRSVRAPRATPLRTAPDAPATDNGSGGAAAPSDLATPDTTVLPGDPATGLVQDPADGQGTTGSTTTPGTATPGQTSSSSAGWGSASTDPGATTAGSGGSGAQSSSGSTSGSTSGSSSTSGTSTGSGSSGTGSSSGTSGSGTSGGGSILPPPTRA